MESSIYPGMDSHNPVFASNSFDSTIIESLEFGRESLGLLPSDIGRESMGFSNPTFLNELRQDTAGLLSNFEFSRDSLLPSDNRESLGILHISTYENHLKAPDILLTTINESESVCDLLNKAFLFPSPRKCSLPSSSSNISFNVNSIEEPSKIFSILSPYDDVFSNSAVNLASLGSVQRNILCPSETSKHLRTKSLPVLKLHNSNHFKTRKLVDGCDINVDSITSVLNNGKFIESSELSRESVFNKEAQELKLKVNTEERLGNENFGVSRLYLK